MEALKDAVRRHAERHADADGLAMTPVTGLRVMRAWQPAGPLRSIYRPLVCLVLQGAKRMRAGGEERLFRGGESVIVAADLPVTGHVVDASRHQPYLAVAIELDMAVMEAVALLAPSPAGADRRAATALFVERLDADIVGCAARLMRLVDTPEAIPVVRPAVMQELHYWLLSSRHGPALRRLALPDGTARRIARAIEVLRADFREPLPVARLAAAATMSTSAFHRHFRSITSLSPLQFQKQLRLIEARRLMRGEGASASRAAVDVGYASASQFTREYARMFGAPPRREAGAGSRRGHVAGDDAARAAG